METIEKLKNFVNQGPGLNFADYGDYKIYNRERREITADRNDFYVLLSLAATRIKDFEKALTEKLIRNTGGRLFMDDKGKIVYHTGQYFPTEYRPAACAILSQMIFADYRDEKQNGQHVYKDGFEIRKAIKRQLPRRVYNNYFN